MALSKTTLKYAFAILAVVGVVVAIRLLPLSRWLGIFNLWVSGLGALGMLVFALMYAVATVLMLPGSLLTLAGGATFGLLPGFVTVLFGATAGAALAFLVSRHLARNRVETWIQKKPSFDVIDKAVAKQGWKIVFLTRLSPVFPFNFQNYAYGLTSVSFVQYTLASWVGMIPGAFLYVYLGTLGRSGLEAASGAQSAETLRLVLQVVGLLATLLVTALITRSAKRALREAGV
ncbi:MAG TPA: TVP38/TMEM64 family protein [Vicinamibacteria bacterium]|nr:TVP38/TMEM64 family protein [Vicinamibacteria bacterium]